jgi:hypothetical protein
MSTGPASPQARLLFPSLVNELPKKSFIDRGFDFPAAAASVSG